MNERDVRKEKYCFPVKRAWIGQGPRPVLGLSHVFSLSRDDSQKMGFEKMQQIGWLMRDDGWCCNTVVILLLDVNNDDDEVRERSYSYSVPY